MESTSQHGRAQVSPSTHAALKDSFVMEPAGTVERPKAGLRRQPPVGIKQSGQATFT